MILHSARRSLLMETSGKNNATVMGLYALFGFLVAGQRITSIYNCYCMHNEGMWPKALHQYSPTQLAATGL